MAEVIVQDPMWHEHARDATGRFLSERLVRTIAEDIRRDCPVKTGRLLMSIKQRGNEIRIGGVEAPYWADVEYNTKPHLILPVRAKVLRWESGGKVHFARRVNHPGTKGKAFIRRNFYRYRTAVYY